MSKSKFVTLLALCLVLSGCAEAKPQTLVTLPAPEEVHYETEPVLREDYRKVGSLAASVSYATVGTVLGRAGKIASIVGDGTQVSKGDVLVTFEPVDKSVDIQEQSLKITRKQSEIEEQKTALQQTLSEAQASAVGLSDHEATIASLQIQSLQAKLDAYVYSSGRELEAMQTSLAKLRAQASPAPLTANADGVARNKGFKVGDTVGNFAVVFEIVSNDSYFLIPGSVSSVAEYANFKTDVEIASKTKKTGFPAQVISAYPSVSKDFKGYSDQQWQMATVRVTDPEVKASTFASGAWCNFVVQFIPDALTVSKQAVHLEAGSYYVNVLEDGKVYKQYVQLGLGMTEDRVWISDGLTEGQTVVLN